MLSYAFSELRGTDYRYMNVENLDTMKDLFVNFIGAIVFCIFGFIYEKVGRKNKTAAMVVEGLKIRPASEEEIKQMKDSKQAAIDESKQKKNNKKKK